MFLLKQVKQTPLPWRLLGNNHLAVRWNLETPLTREEKDPGGEGWRVLQCCHCTSEQLCDNLGKQAIFQ